MSIITINRGSYSRGKAVAEKLAQRLGYECISRDILLEASEEFNIPEMKLVRALHDAPSVLDRFSFGKERYVSYIQSALLQHVRKDNIVYHGLAGQFLLQGIPHVFKVRILADMQDRVNEEMRRHDISAEKALYTLQKDDEERRKWSMFLYGMDTWDSRLYDLVVHIHKLSVDDAVDIIATSARKPAFQTTADSRQVIENLALAARVKASLIDITPKIQVEAEGGKVHIHPLERSLQTDELEQLKTAASQMEGVAEVIINMGVQKESHDHINPFHNIG
ncbi:MAG: cytidylate kinase-like family protein [Desulfobacteraceae bacterium]|nr:cytidylate kinase-like family protein [Desulfobacteraceae bacterium]